MWLMRCVCPFKNVENNETPASCVTNLRTDSLESHDSHLRGNESSIEREAGTCSTSYTNLIIGFEELTFHQLLVKGSLRSVYRGRWNNTAVAITYIERGGMLDAAHALHRLGNHPNLVQFYRWATNPEGHECLVMEYVHTGSLRKAFENPGLSFTTRSKLAVCEQICSAMCELSQEKVMHGGLSANNVLIVSMEPVHIKVANHGLLRLRKEEVKPDVGPSTISPCTSDREHWKAPEVMADNGSEWSEKSDVWSFGTTVWEIFSEKSLPHGAVCSDEMVSSIKTGRTLSRPSGCPREIYALMLACWDEDLKNRPTFQDIAAMFKGWREHYAFEQGSGQTPHSNYPASMKLPQRMEAQSHQLPKLSSLLFRLTASAPPGASLMDLHLSERQAHADQPKSDVPSLKLEHAGSSSNNPALLVEEAAATLLVPGTPLDPATSFQERGIILHSSSLTQMQSTTSPATTPRLAISNSLSKLRYPAVPRMISSKLLSLQQMSGFSSNHDIDELPRLSAPALDKTIIAVESVHRPELTELPSPHKIPWGSMLLDGNTSTRRASLSALPHPVSFELSERDAGAVSSSLSDDGSKSTAGGNSYPTSAADGTSPGHDISKGATAWAATGRRYMSPDLTSSPQKASHIPGHRPGTVLPGFCKRHSTFRMAAAAAFSTPPGPSSDPGTFKSYGATSSSKIKHDSSRRLNGHVSASSHRDFNQQRLREAGDEESRSLSTAAHLSFELEAEIEPMTSLVSDFSLEALSHHQDPTGEGLMTPRCLGP